MDDTCVSVPAECLKSATDTQLPFPVPLRLGRAQANVSAV